MNPRNTISNDSSANGQWKLSRGSNIPTKALPNDSSTNGQWKQSHGSNIPMKALPNNKTHGHVSRGSNKATKTSPPPNVKTMQKRVAEAANISIGIAADALVRTDFDVDKAINQRNNPPAKFKRHSSSNDLPINGKHHHVNRDDNRPASTPPKMNSSASTIGSPKESVKEILFIETGIATWNQTHSIFTKAVKNSGIKCKFEIVMPKNEKGEYKGFAFVWFSDVRVSNRLVGRNDDGTERFQMVIDSTWTMPEEFVGKDFDEVLDERLSGETNWATQSEIHDKIKKLNTPPKIKSLLPTLLPIPPIRYNRSQLANLDKNPEVGKIIVTYATIRRYRERRTTNVIFGDVPDWMTEDIIYKHFRRYVTVNEDTYPSVKLIERHDRKNQKLRKVAYVYFSPTGLDAQTAAVMSFDFTFNHEKHGKVKLHFVHPYDRKAPKSPISR